MTDEKPLIAAADVTEEILLMAEDVHDGWYADERNIDWEGFIDRLERHSERDWGSQMDSPAINKVKRHIREIRKAG